MKFMLKIDSLPVKILFIPQLQGTVCLKLKLLSMKKENHLYASLFIACQARSSDLTDFFQHENHSFPPSISEYGKLRKTSKADFLQCLEQHSSNTFTAPSDITAKIVDGAVLVQALKPGLIKTFGDYAKKFHQGILAMMSEEKIDRLDIVFDRYLDRSLKEETRESRGSGIRINVKENTPIWKDWGQFLRNNENKNELFALLANVMTKDVITGKVLIATCSEYTLASEPVAISELSPCNHEEADSRIFVHLRDMKIVGHRKVLIRTVDTDIVVIALSMFQQLDLEELWIEFGFGKTKRWIPVHLLSISLGKEKCEALPLWFALTGCDTVSSFCGRGKKICWNVWTIYPELTHSLNKFEFFLFSFFVTLKRNAGIYQNVVCQNVVCQNVV